ncbi:hypothetical protein ROJ8625_04099 [Roseivivax jejudonensis]|uniref:Uncharacterized protein n=1 Tax=Roseivivax jejudonensis TaxID=1529041 RepID=A0A1X7ABE9_9RHOB|nr:hypothetical protein [Roseivivax jejudonensis]SLN74775.1 hypothetical protein ROJ8625_04099 [Roseivivax jejudonensis]
MRERYRYIDGRMVGDDGMPMLHQGQRAMEPQAPFTVGDSQPHLQSMTNGKYYDSKSEMRKEYKRAGVVEVGNDVPHKRAQPSIAEKERKKRERRASAAKALSQAGFGAP